MPVERAHENVFAAPSRIFGDIRASVREVQRARGDKGEDRMQLEAMIRATKNHPLGPSPIKASWIERGSPEATSALLMRSDDGAALAVVWACTAGRFTWRYDSDETAYFLDGGVTIQAPGQPELRLGAGDSIHFCRGSVATWTIDSHVRKVAFLRRAPSRRVSFWLRIAQAWKRRLLGWLRPARSAGSALANI